MKLSIIIPLYNFGKYLPKCIESLLSQNVNESDFEIIVVNDGSTDNSLEIANGFSKIYTNVIVHDKVNGGVGSARNKGMSLAKGDYIYFIDPDDYLVPNTLKILLTIVENNNLDILTFISKPITDSELHDVNPRTNDISMSSVYTGIDFIANYNYQNEVWWYLIKRSFIEEAKIQFIEDRWMEDAIITAQLFLKANRMANMPLDAHRHLMIEGSAMTSKEPEHYLKVIDDNSNAALVFESLINALIKKSANPKCIERLRVRQQSFVFFMMVRMLKSTIHINEVKFNVDKLSLTKAYPLNSFPNQDYKGASYKILTWLFNSKSRFYSLFKLMNPIFRVIS
jgi:glycosyltransferase involved in cell wall biosynthesis